MFNGLQELGLSPIVQFERLLDYYQPIFERLYYDDYPKRSRDLEQLRTIIEGYENLAAFVADTALDPPEIVGRTDVNDKLVLSTVHSAKGLEWDTVFVINLAEGKFPHAYSQPGEQQEEERRLFYVAATRAKNHLFLTYPSEVTTVDRKRARANLTPFLADISPGLYELVARQSPLYSAAVPYTTARRGMSDRIGGGTVPKARLDASRLKKGDSVKHPFFGRGEIEELSGPRSVIVHFAKHGRKTLHLDFAKLELVK
jgi:DNA helicase-2/ATP-dependent DNA helicase PcrA